MGVGIAAMHYIGMEAMRLPAMCHYSLGLVTLSVFAGHGDFPRGALADVSHPGKSATQGWRKLASAIVMGAAIPVMHYTGMAAVTLCRRTRPRN